MNWLPQGGSGVGEQDRITPLKYEHPRDPDAWIQLPMEKYRKRKRTMKYRPGPEFFMAADAVIQSERTLLGYDRLYVFWQAIRNIAAVPGNAAEIGTYRGGSAFFLAAAFRALVQTTIRLDVFDTFEGHPAAALSEQDTRHREAGLFNGTSYADVSAYLSAFDNVHVHRGDVLLALSGLPEAAYRFVHVDTDLYLPTKACLEYFGSRLSPGGVIVVDDYSSKTCPGVRDAAVEYLATQHAYQVWDQRTKQLVLVKNG